MRKNEKGYTLLEALIAITILTIIGVILANFIFLSINIRNANRERQEALKVTSSIIDEIKSYQRTWKDSDGLETWLSSHGFLKIGTGTYKRSKTDSHEIQYETTLEISPLSGVDGLFRLILRTNSPHTNGITIAAGFRG